MSRIFIAGIGAVSPAGWGVPALCAALARNRPLPIQQIERPGWERPLRVRTVPQPATRPPFLGHPRLRRASPITHHATAVALEAVAGLESREKSGRRLGLVVCLQSGCVNYSRRFLGEALEDPATASPLLFPETVYAGPASHVAAVLGNVSISNTLVGDPACYHEGVVIGAQWLEENRVDACIIVGAEETDWILADALWHLDRPAVLAAGAGALCLCADLETPGVMLAAVTDPHTYSTCHDRSRSARAMRDQLGAGGPTELLCDGIGDSPRRNAAERSAWRNWPGARSSPGSILGEGLMAGAAWQCVVACEAVASGRFTAANVSLVGSNQQAIGARFVSAGAATGDLSGGGTTPRTSL